MPQRPQQPLQKSSSDLQGTLSVATTQTMELTDITGQLVRALGNHIPREGICCLFNPHTTAGLTINEGCDPAVKDDIITGLRTMVPLNLSYKHQEGNSPAHIMASLMGSSLTIFIQNSQLQLGTWQKIFFCEFDGPRSRTIHWRILAA